MSATTLPDSVPHWTHEHETVALDEDCWEIVDLVATARAKSYLDGRTHEVILDAGDLKNEDAYDTMYTGTAAEVAVALELDKRVLEGVDLEMREEGDDGWDVELNDGSHTIDVKGHWFRPTQGRSSLIVDTDKVADENADAYVCVQVWSGGAVVHGWLTRSEVRERGRIEGPPRWQQSNWVVDAEDLRPVSELREWVDGAPF